MSFPGRVPRLDTSKPDVLARDLDRAQRDNDARFGLLEHFFRRLLRRPPRAITHTMVRPTLKLDEAAHVYTAGGPLTLYLPRARPSDAGRVAAFVKRYANNYVNLRTADGSLINGYPLIHGLTQMGLHELLWDGEAWWFREPRARIRTHDTSFRPVGLWQFTDVNAPLADTSGNGFTLTVETGTQRGTFTDIHRGGFYFDGSTALIYNVAEAALRLTGDMSFFCLWVNHTGVNSSSIVTHQNSGELEADNLLYRLGYATYPTLIYSHEQGAGVDVSYTLDGLVSLPGHLVHIGFTREDDVVQVWHNGRPFGAPSSALTTPTGGADGRFRLGGNPTVRANGAMTSAMLCDYAMSGAEVRRAYNMTMGPAYSFVIEVGDA